MPSRTLRMFYLPPHLTCWNVWYPNSPPNLSQPPPREPELHQASASRGDKYQRNLDICLRDIGNPRKSAITSAMRLIRFIIFRVFCHSLGRWTWRRLTSWRWFPNDWWVTLKWLYMQAYNDSEVSTYEFKISSWRLLSTGYRLHKLATEGWRQRALINIPFEECAIQSCKTCKALMGWGSNQCGKSLPKGM